MIALAQPDLEGNEAKYVAECLSSGWISSTGKFLSLFERAFAEYVGVKHAVSTNNGTTALHLALVALGIGPGDEVIVPTVTYVATANAVAYCGATPVLVDVLPGTLNLDTRGVSGAITAKTKAVIAVHLYGYPAEVELIRSLCDEKGIWLVEDAAEAHGATIQGKQVGSFGHVGVFSFYGNKIITTGEGGMVTTNDEELADRLRLLRGQGMDPKRRYWFPVVGFNYRMTNIEAAIGLAQLERIDSMMSTRQSIEFEYKQGLSNLGNRIERVVLREGDTNVPWLMTVFLTGADETRRDKVIAELFKKGIDSRPVFYPMHHLPAYEDGGKYPVADDWSYRGLSLPLHTALQLQEVRQICDSFVEILNRE